jgi:hypothetical protein
LALAVCGLALPLACSTPAGPPDAADAAIYKRAEAERLAWLESELARLRADLEQAEKTMTWLESDLRNSRTRAEAVSVTAEARVALARARERAPWRAEECDVAAAKLAEAERLLQEERVGAAIFFASRARRIADDVVAEARLVEQARDALFVSGERVNLREAPSTQSPVVAVLEQATPVFPERRSDAWVLVRTQRGRVGWVYASLLRPRGGGAASRSSATTTQSLPEALAR